MHRPCQRPRTHCRTQRRPCSGDYRPWAIACVLARADHPGRPSFPHRARVSVLHRPRRQQVRPVIPLDGRTRTFAHNTPTDGLRVYAPHRNRPKVRHRIGEHSISRARRDDQSTRPSLRRKTSGCTICPRPHDAPTGGCRLARAAVKAAKCPLRRPSPASNWEKIDRALERSVCCVPRHHCSWRGARRQTGRHDRYAPTDAREDMRSVRHSRGCERYMRRYPYEPPKDASRSARHVRRIRIPVRHTTRHVRRTRQHDCPIRPHDRPGSRLPRSRSCHDSTRATIERTSASWVRQGARDAGRTHRDDCHRGKDACPTFRVPCLMRRHPCAALRVDSATRRIDCMTRADVCNSLTPARLTRHRVGCATRDVCSRARGPRSPIHSACSLALIVSNSGSGVSPLGKTVGRTRTGVCECGKGPNPRCWNTCPGTRGDCS